MKKSFVFTFLLFCVMMAVMVSSLSAQQEGRNKRIGTAAATELLIPVGARDLAMGGASMAVSQGVDAIFWNPAGLARQTNAAEGTLTTMSYIADIRVNYGAVGIVFSGFGTIGLSVKTMDFGEIPLTTNDDPENLSGRTYSPTLLNVGLSFSRAFTDAITAGATFKVVSEKLGRVNGSGFALDLGVQYHNIGGLKGLHMGVALKNIGPQVSFEGPGLLRTATSRDGRRSEQFYSSKAASFELPSSVELGLAYSRSINESLSWTVNGTFANNNLSLDGYRGGGELGYKSGSIGFAARGGIELSPTESGVDEQIFGPTAGFGLSYAAPGIDLTLDYAYRQVDFFSSNNMFSIKFGF
ncbi:PorV/PorQ family protein [candidate division KSB1 bacterium]|nr:PorV/PorQ family protein [candidate division KSB1 bacterium]